MYKKYRKTVKKEKCTKYRRGHKILLADRLKANPKELKYSKGKRLASKRIGPIGDNWDNQFMNLGSIDEVLNEYL